MQIWSQEHARGGPKAGDASRGEEREGFCWCRWPPHFSSWARCISVPAEVWPPVHFRGFVIDTPENSSPFLSSGHLHKKKCVCVCVWRPLRQDSKLSWEAADGRTHAHATRAETQETAETRPSF